MDNRDLRINAVGINAVRYPNDHSGGQEAPADDRNVIDDGELARRHEGHRADKFGSRVYAVGQAAGPASAPFINGDNKMTIYEVRLEGREEIAEGTMAFHFEKPTGFSFKAGQAIDVVLIDPPTTDAQSARHMFSIVSAPFQGELVVATRMRDSAFKRALKSLPIGSPAKLEGPFGSLTLHNDRARAAIFIAGGIGITPFMSSLRQAAKHQLPQRLLLLYSNRRPEDAAFLAELQQLEQQNKNFRLLATMTEMNNSARKWDGATGFVNADMVKHCAGELAAPICYVVGPPAMVEAMKEVLSRAGVAPRTTSGPKSFMATSRAFAFA